MPPPHSKALSWSGIKNIACRNSSSPNLRNGDRTTTSSSALPSSGLLAAPSASTSTSAGSTSTASSTADASLPSNPNPNEPIAVLRLRILAARNLAPKDRNGLADPYVVATFTGVPEQSSGSGRSREFKARRSTPPVPKDLNPRWPEHDATFDVLVTPSWFGALGQRSSDAGPSPPKSTRIGTAKRVAVKSVTMGRRGNKPRLALQPTAGVGDIDLVMWDKDRFGKNDYMGELSLAVADWCPVAAGWNDPQNEPQWHPLLSSRRSAKISGDILVKVGFLPPPSLSSDTAFDADALYAALTAANSRLVRSSVRHVPANQSVGTTGPSEAFIDDGLSFSSSSDDDSDDELSSPSESEGGQEEDDHPFFEYADGSKVPDPSRLAPEVQPTPSGPASVAPSNISGASTPTAPTTFGFAALPAVAPSRKNRFRLRSRSQNTASGDLSRSGLESGTTTPPSANELALALADADGGKTGKRIRSRRAGREARAERRRIAKEAKSSARRTRRRRREKRGEYAFSADAGREILGIVMVEVKEAQDLPRWRNMTRTGFDMDPFTIVSFGQKVFRTRVVRHSLNPVWDEKLLFHVRRHETNFQIKFSIYDWDKMSSNDYVGGTELSVAELICAAPKPDDRTGLYAPDEDGKHSMIEFKLPVTRVEKDEDVKWGDKHSPTITFKAKYTPYEALRQRFWRQLLQQYDTDDTNTLSHLELSSMLDSLGSTLSKLTIDSFFERNGKTIDDQLTFDEAVLCLEREITRPWSEKRWASKGALESGTVTPSAGDEPYALEVTGPSAPGETNVPLLKDHDSAPIVVPGTVHEPTKESTDDSKPAFEPIRPGPDRAGDDESIVATIAAMGSLSMTPATSSVPSSRSAPSSFQPSSYSQQPSYSQLSYSTPATTDDGEDVSAEEVLADGEEENEGEEGSPPGTSPDDADAVERVILLKSCPLCHMPRLSKKAEVDIVTHLAVCASQDWRRVDRIVVGNFVTASQAHRKWYTKMFSKISTGSYQLGANSANIIVQDRMTGEMLEEKMQVYVRLGIRLLYKGAHSKMEGARVRRMLKSMSVKQGLKYDSPASAREIPPFIAFHNLNMDEVLEPASSFTTFNEFFYRKLKPGARAPDDPSDPATLVSGADCRMMAFESVGEATRIWIKGREFSVGRLLGETYGKEASRFEGGGLVIFRLAPQDYHRFHSPVDGKVGNFSWIEGQYYTVNPMAIRSAIDVYGENVRVVVPFDSPSFGHVMAVCIGAMMVGSTVLTVKPGDEVKRAQEFGYFKFGGSTIVLLFERGAVKFDDDLLENSRGAIETLVRVGMRIGRATGTNGGSANAGSATA